LFAITCVLAFLGGQRESTTRFLDLNDPVETSTPPISQLLNIKEDDYITFYNYLQDICYNDDFAQGRGRKWYMQCEKALFFSIARDAGASMLNPLFTIGRPLN